LNSSELCTIQSSPAYAIYALPHQRETRTGRKVTPKRLPKKIISFFKHLKKLYEPRAWLPVRLVELYRRQLLRWHPALVTTSSCPRGGAHKISSTASSVDGNSPSMQESAIPIKVRASNCTFDIGHRPFRLNRRKDAR